MINMLIFRRKYHPKILLCSCDSLLKTIDPSGIGWSYPWFLVGFTHSGHVIPPVNSKDIGALKAAVIYGANASGKSNLIKAMHFARLMITQGSPQGKNLNYDPFLLDKGCSQKPSRFEFEIKCGNNNYAYGFIADSKSIREEWLYKIDKKGESPVFVRTDEHKILFPAIKFKSKEDEQFLSFTAKATPEHPPVSF